MPASKKPKQQLEREIERIRREGSSAVYYPGGSGGGGSRRGRGAASAVVLPHARTSASCTLCPRYHTTADHLRHARKSSSPKTKTKTRAAPTAPTRRRPTIIPEPALSHDLTPALLLSAVRDALPRIGSEGRYGDEKVFVSAIWHMLKADPRLRTLSLERFKRWLVAANRDGDLRLARADLVGAMNPKLVAESEISDHGATFHFVLDPSRQRF